MIIFGKALKSSRAELDGEENRNFVYKWKFWESSGITGIQATDVNFGEITI